MIHRLAAFFGSTNENFKLTAYLGLANVVVKQLGTQGAFDGFFTRGIGCGGHNAFGGNAWSEVVSLDGHFANAFSANLIPSLTPTSFGKALSASAASRSL